MSEELAYSIHLGSDKNKTAKAKEIAKNNPSGETSFSNNGIQNATQLSKVNKHNLRDYDNDKENIQIIYGTDNLYKDMQNLYFQEFEQARIEYNGIIKMILDIKCRRNRWRIQIKFLSNQKLLY